MRRALAVAALVLCVLAAGTAVLALAFGEPMWWLLLPLALACLVFAVLLARDSTVPPEETPDFLRPVSMCRLPCSDPALSPSSVRRSDS